MAEIKNTWGKRALAGFGALALASAGLLGGSTAASAATELGNIDFSAEKQDKTSLTIHKYQHQNGTEEKAPDGSDGIFADPLQDVVFTAYPITSIDLKENADWARLKTLTPGTTCASLGSETLGAGIEFDPTDGAGQATLEKLAIGAYLVCETDAPETVVDRALPFIVTIPMPYDNGWLYNVHVYPKNGITSIKKDVSAPSGLGLGSTVQFPVTTQVPRVAANSALTGYVVSDTLDSRLDPVSVASVTIDGVAVDSNFYTEVLDGYKLSVVFKTEGLEFLSDPANRDKEIVIAFQGVVKTLGDDGVIENTATVFVNDPVKGVESNEVVTKWGDVRILKYAAPKTEEGVKAGLAGAVFEVYSAGEGTYAGGKCEGAVATGSAISVIKDRETKTQFMSDADGLINIDGLFVSDSKTGAAADQACYVLKEVQAPAGYVLPADPFTAVAVKTGNTATAVYDAQVANTQQEVPELPLTGANGQMVMVIGGSALLLIAGGVVMLNRRRSANEQQN